VKRLAFVLFHAAVAFVVLGTGPSFAQSPTQSIWKGVFTVEQAARGEAGYQANCNRCHGEINKTSPWIGLDDFMDHWREDSIENFFTFVKTYMPPQRGRTPRQPLADEAYVDIITYILKTNGVPPGERELKSDILAAIRIEEKDGPKPLPHGAFAAIVGCLQPLNATTWIVSMATEPVRTRVNEFTDAERKAAETEPLGNLTFRLQNIDYVGDSFDPKMHVGQRIQIKGSLIRQPNAERIDVRSLVIAGEKCP